MKNKFDNHKHIVLPCCNHFVNLTVTALRPIHFGLYFNYTWIILWIISEILQCL